MKRVILPFFCLIARQKQGKIEKNRKFFFVFFPKNSKNKAVSEFCLAPSRLFQGTSKASFCASFKQSQGLRMKQNT